MKVVIQRVTEGEVVVEGKRISQIKEGLLVLLAIHKDDTEEDRDWLINKMLNLRIFTDQDGKMNRSIQDTQGEILIVSQFTLYAETKKGNRPSFIRSAEPNKALTYYENVVDRLKKKWGSKVKTGKFGALMKVSLTNDGPVTIIIDSKNKE